MTGIPLLDLAFFAAWRETSLAHVAPVADRLAVYYPDEGSVRRVLALAGVDARRIAISGQAANTWWAACVEAAHQGRLRELVEVALEEYPLDDWLQAVHGRLVQGGKDDDDAGGCA